MFLYHHGDTSLNFFFQNKLSLTDNFTVSLLPCFPTHVFEYFSILSNYLQIVRSSQLLCFHRDSAL